MPEGGTSSSLTVKCADGEEITVPPDIVKLYGFFANKVRFAETSGSPVATLVSLPDDRFHSRLVTLAVTDLNKTQKGDAIGLLQLVDFLQPEPECRQGVLKILLCKMISEKWLEGPDNFTQRLFDECLQTPLVRELVVSDVVVCSQVGACLYVHGYWKPNQVWAVGSTDWVGLFPAPIPVQSGPVASRSGVGAASSAGPGGGMGMMAGGGSDAMGMVGGGGVDTGMMGSAGMGVMGVVGGGAGMMGGGGAGMGVMGVVGGGAGMMGGGGAGMGVMG
eukprot:Cvel_17504.t1-p1 / transcript=Cvel_17504.t1 / gene=Cvel_17504 / organism=Chromera_velia_CCMP2878 / gene_product=hypothetical protein / transcript_product=hypothetical protein / location=Cvel_scaffold1402:1-2350(-) / protein_length=275 / sequence_SO=supercontig / SO=protein_coding / is_pseudo=false